MERTDEVSDAALVQKASASEVEDTYVLFAGDAVFELVPKANGRVYALKFESSSMRRFFWMQDADASGDAAFCSSLMSFVNDSSEEMEEDESPVAQATASSSSGSAAPMDTGAILKNLARQIPVHIPEILTSRKIIEFLDANPKFYDQLYEFLPAESAKTPAEVKETVKSPQFAQAVHMLQSAIESEDSASLIYQFGLEIPTDQQFVSMTDAFLAAILRKYKQ